MKAVGRYSEVTLHEMKMLELAKPKGLLPVRMYQQDGFYHMIYDEKIYQPMVVSELEQSVTSKDMVRLFRALASSIISCYDYLLDVNRLMIDLDLLYQDDGANVYILYCPSKENEGVFDDLMETLILRLLNTTIENEVIIDHLHQLHRSLLSKQLNGLEMGALMDRLSGGWL